MFDAVGQSSDVASEQNSSRATIFRCVNTAGVRNEVANFNNHCYQPNVAFQTPIASPVEKSKTALSDFGFVSKRKPNQ